MTLAASRFNAPGQAHADVYVRPRHDRIPLRYADGSETGFALARDQLVYSPRYAARVRGARDGCLRLDHHEVLDVPGTGGLVFHRGGNGYLDAANVKYGHVALDDLEDRPGRPARVHGRRGASASLSSLGDHAVVVVPIPAAMNYKSFGDRPVGVKHGAKWLHYADPAAQQGDRDDIHYTVLVWSWPRDSGGGVCAGGGMVRALLAPGTVVQLCDVAAIESPSWDKESELNGDVVGVYVRAPLAGNELYGWVMHSHRYERAGEPPDYVAHLRRL